MHRILIFTFLILILILTASSFYMMGSVEDKKPTIKKSATTATNPTFSPYTARFKIYTDGTKRDFSPPKYHNRTDDVYITESDPEKIYINKDNTTWQEFFDSLPSPMMLTATCLTTGTGQNFCSNSEKKLTFYLNDVQAKNVLLDNINPGDELTIIYGNISQISEVLGIATGSASKKE